MLMSMDSICMLWRHVCALLLRHDICCVDMLYALWTCLLVGEEYMVSSCWRRIYGSGRCFLVGEEYMAVEDVFLLDKSIWIWKMFSCWRRIYGYGRCLLVREEYMNMEDALLFFRVITLF